MEIVLMKLKTIYWVIIMMTYKMKDVDEMIKFITSMQEFLKWETLICRFSTTNGLNLDMNTQIVDSLGQASFIELQFLLPTINNFYKTIVENNYSEVNVQIKLRLPTIFKNKYDPNNEYEGFFLNATSDKLVTVISTTHLERTRESGLQPITNWEEYIMGIYQQFKEKQRKQQL